MKDNFTHVCFVIDESGSMYSSIDDVRGGYEKIIKEQKANTVGNCSVSMFTFNGKITEHYTLKDVSEVSDSLEYSPGGGTALNDGVGTAIDRIGKKLAAMPEEERPSSNLIVIMTDGGENCSKEYPLATVREKIKHQTDKYNWTFMYLGADIMDSSIADTLGLKYRAFSTKKDLNHNYSLLNSVINSVRCASSVDAAATMDSALTYYANTANAKFAKETSIKLGSVSV